MSLNIDTENYRKISGGRKSKTFLVINHCIASIFFFTVWCSYIGKLNMDPGLMIPAIIFVPILINMVVIGIFEKNS